jgi:predicted metalloprotease with PDZ domain
MAPRISYRIRPDKPRAHLFHVELTIDAPAKDQEVWLPVWIPGSYMIREFARHVVTLDAKNDVGVAVAVEKTDKHAWRLHTVGTERSVVVSTVIYAWDLSVRAAHLDTTHGFFNGPSVFLAVEGRLNEPCRVTIDPPSDALCVGWKVATTLPATDVATTGFGTYTAADYDELIDHPVEMGTFHTVKFAAGGVPHEMVITGRIRDLDDVRLARDLTAICGEQIRLFHGHQPSPDNPAPFSRYLFMTMAITDGYGGLEHRSSTALVCKRDDLPRIGMDAPTDGYRQFLGLCSHEYFHSWNVKRIKPSSFVPYNLKHENYTKQLWFFEGITSYYDDLALVRCGAITEASWLELLGQTTTKVLRSHGRHKQTLEQSSHDTWVKYYRQDENSVNSQISYYLKGALAGLALDVKIRDATADARSLDDVMVALWDAYGKNESGVPEGAIERVASDVAGVDLSSFFDATLRSTTDIALAPLLSSMGLALHTRPLDGDHDAGGKPSVQREQRAALGAVVGGPDAHPVLSNVQEGSAAQAAGLSAGDAIVAVDGLQATKSMLGKLHERAPGDLLRVHYFRRDELHETTVRLLEARHEAAFVLIDDRASASAHRRRAQWLLRMSVESV